MLNLAKNTKEPSVILMDRGLMDTVGYSGLEIWAKILKHTGWNNIDLRDKRYDAIIHMVTAADGAAEFYNLDNTARYETVEEAVATDKALQTAYIGHNKIFVIDNKVGFNGKI